MLGDLPDDVTELQRSVQAGPQQVADRMIELCFWYGQSQSAVRLGIHVYEKRFLSFARKDGSEVDRQSGFATTAFLIDDRDRPQRVSLSSVKGRAGLLEHILGRITPSTGLLVT